MLARAASPESAPNNSLIPPDITITPNFTTILNIAQAAFPAASKATSLNTFFSGPAAALSALVASPVLARIICVVCVDTVIESCEMPESLSASELFICSSCAISILLMSNTSHSLKSSGWPSAASMRASQYSKVSGKASLPATKICSFAYSCASSFAFSLTSFLTSFQIS